MGMIIASVIVFVVVLMISFSRSKKEVLDDKELAKKVVKSMEDSFIKEVNEEKRKLERKLALIEGREVEEDEEEFTIKFEQAIYEERPADYGTPVNKFGCRIAGLQYNWVNVFPGGFIGYAAAEPLNPEDSEAVAIYDINGDIVGYVPRGAKEEYDLEFPDKATCLAVGWIKEESEMEREYSSYVIFIRIHSWKYALDEFIRTVKMYQDKGWEFEESEIKRVGEHFMSYMEEDEGTEEDVDYM